MSMKYPIKLFLDEDDQTWVATAPDLPGCSAVGDTPLAAREELETTAIPLWIEAMKDAENPIPDPRKYSGRIALRIPSSLHGLLADRARIEGVSLNQCILYILASSVKS